MPLDRWIVLPRSASFRRTNLRLSCPGRTVSLALLLAWTLLSGTVTAQIVPHTVIPLREALHDADGDGVPDRTETHIVTAGRVATDILGRDDDWQDFFLQSGDAGISIVIPTSASPPEVGDSIVVSGMLWQEHAMTMMTHTDIEIVAAAKCLFACSKIAFALT